MEISINKIDICYRHYSEFAVVYDLRNQQILKLENVAADIMSFLFDKGTSQIDEIVNYIVSIYDCNENDIYDDIIDFVQDLYDSGVILFNDNYTNIAVVLEEDIKSATSNDNLENQIISELESENQLYSATIEMTYACNEKCVHCYAHYPNADCSHGISLDTYKDFIYQLKEQKCMHIAFTGGDPFMNPSFPRVFAYARANGFVCDIFTNGLFLSNHMKELDRIAELRPRAFYISLYGSTPEVHDNVTQIPGSFDKTVSVVKKLRSYGIPVVFNVMLLSINYQDFQCIIELANELNAEYRTSMSLIYRNDGNDSPMNYFIGDKEAIKNIMKKMNNIYSIDKPIEHDTDSQYLCGAGVTSICLSPTGEVYPCVSLKNSLGNIFKSTLKDIWNGEERKKIVTGLTWNNTKKCYKCEYQKKCPHCAGMSQAETGDMYECNSCDRFIAECISEL